MENNGMEDILKDSQFTEMDPESPEFVEGIFNEMVELHNDLVGLLQDLSAGHPDKHDLMKVRIISPAFILVRYTALFMIKPECIYFKHKYEEVKAVAWDLSNYGEAFEKGDRTWPSWLISLPDSGNILPTCMPSSQQKVGRLTRLLQAE
jgi:hypothetical protein